MSADPGLERRYRRLLAWYPAAHRRSHGEEMIGVLLASSREGQHRPRPAEALDLIGSGLRIRLRAAIAWRPGRAARDALAVFSLCVPAVWLISMAAALPAAVASMSGTGLRNQVVVFGLVLVQGCCTVVPVVLGWHGRPLAGAAIAIVPAGLLSYLALSQPVTPGAFCGSLLFTAQAAALLTSPGPRRGAALMTGRTWAVTAGAGAAIGWWQGRYTLGSEETLLRLAGQGAAAAFLIAVAVAAGFLLTLPRPVAGRLLLLAGPTAWLGVLGSIGLPDRAAISGSLLAVYLPALALAAVTIAAGLIRRWWRPPRAQATGR